jgi:hypothetical protein
MVRATEFEPAIVRVGLLVRAGKFEPSSLESVCD